MKKLFLTLFFFNTLLLLAQPEFDGQYLRVGRGLGISSFNNAYTITDLSVPTLPRSYIISGDRINNGFWDITYGNFTDYMLYEIQGDGTFNSFLNLVTNKDLQYKPLVNLNKLYPVTNGGAAAVKDLNAKGVDNNIIDASLCFGARYFYAGVHYNFGQLGTYGNYGSGNMLVQGNYKGSSNYTSLLGIGVHHIRNYFNLFKVHHTVNFDFKAFGNTFTGNCISTQHTIYWGKAGYGLYLTPYFKWRFGGNEVITYDAYQYPNFTGVKSSVAFGIKIGIYLTNGKESISYSRGGGSINVK
ncbi:MAG: hypothetical protein JSU07_14235 [Bacteroidetes bacterium]|nr:hypothetical protein [Bacteroidota bacterium]